MNRFWPWIVSLGGLGVLVADFYATGMEVLFVENEGLPDNINAIPLRMSALIGLVIFIAGLVVGISRRRRPK
jgi:hypothetical protein